MRNTRSGGALNRRRIVVILVAASIIAMIVFRLVALDSDAFPGLSWSTALLTDEGFYIHNARNVVLFGTDHTDQFNNMLIMPALHFIQVAVFRVWGVGARQARLISVVFSFMTLPLFFLALDRSLGRPTALVGTLFLGLDHVNLLYNRLALMDSPAACVLLVVLLLWVIGQLHSGWKRRTALYGVGLTLMFAYAIRGLAGPLFVVPFLTIYFDTRSMPNANENGDTQANRRRNFLEQVTPVFLGLVTGLLIYFTAWYIPNRLELTRVNHYYLKQFFPTSVSIEWRVLTTSLFGTTRGIVPYLMRHTPVMFVLAFAWIASRFPNLGPVSNTNETITGDDPDPRPSHVAKSTLTFAAVWLLSLFVVLSVAEYSPSRYYVLLYPPLAALAAYALCHLQAFLIPVLHRPVIAASISALVAYHLTSACVGRFEHAASAAASRGGAIAAIIVGCSALAACYRGLNSPWPTAIRGSIPQAMAAILTLWFVINAGWTFEWLDNLTYRQRDADRWLQQNLPQNSVLFGAVAPGLCLNSKFRCVSMIKGLCNDDEPLEHAVGAPRYVLVLDDDDFREVWWFKHYGSVMQRENRIKTFPRLLRPDFIVGVYNANER